MEHGVPRMKQKYVTAAVARWCSMKKFTPATLLKKSLSALAFSCEFRVNFKKTFFTKHLQLLLLMLIFFCYSIDLFITPLQIRIIKQKLNTTCTCRISQQRCSLKKVVGKEALAQAFSYEFCEISKNTFLQNTCGGLLLYFLNSVFHRTIRFSPFFQFH